MPKDKYFFDVENHVHSLNGKRLMGTSTVVGVLHKPLNWWVAAETLYPLGWSKYNMKVPGGYKAVPVKDRLPLAKEVHKQIKEWDTEEYLKYLDLCYKAHDKKKDKAAEEGTDRHAILEAWIKDCMTKNDGKPMAVDYHLPPEILDFIYWSLINVKRFLWSEIHGYSKTLWTGGVADVGWEDYKGRVIAGDFKSSKEIYLSQYIQIGGYNLMLEENGGYTADGEQIFTLDRQVDGYMIIPFGQKNFYKELFVFEDVEVLKSAFRSCVHLHGLNEQYKKIIKEQEQKKASAKDSGSLADALAAIAK